MFRIRSSSNNSNDLQDLAGSLFQGITSICSSGAAINLLNVSNLSVNSLIATGAIIDKLTITNISGNFANFSSINFGQSNLNQYSIITGTSVVWKGPIANTNSTLNFIRIGNMVMITLIGINVASNNTSSVMESSTVVIPTEFRPSLLFYLPMIVINASTYVISNIGILPDGTINIYGSFFSSFTATTTANHGFYTCTFNYSL